MKLITETSFQEIESLVENTASGRKYKIEGPFATFDKINENKRIYQKAVMEVAMNKYIAEKVSIGRGFGELNHPQSPQVNFERVVMVIKTLNCDNKNHWIGKGEIIDEGLGKIVCAIMDAGGQIGVSTRALGTVRMQEGISYVNNDLVFSAVDVVSDPSGPGCFVKGIMENTSFEMLEDGRVIELAVDKVVKKKITEEKALKEFANLMLKFGK